MSSLCEGKGGSNLIISRDKNENLIFSKMFVISNSFLISKNKISQSQISNTKKSQSQPSGHRISKHIKRISIR